MNGRSGKSLFDAEVVVDDMCVAHCCHDETSHISLATMETVDRVSLDDEMALHKPGRK